VRATSADTPAADTGAGRKRKREALVDPSVQLPASKGGESLAALRAMIAGEVVYTEAQKQYVSLPISCRNKLMVRWIGRVGTSRSTARWSASV
jgi:hypothetical protein